MLDDRQLDKLEALLLEEAKEYADLVTKSRAQNEALLVGEQPAIEASLHEQIGALQRCQIASEARATYSAELSTELGLGAPCGTGRLLGALPGGDDGLRRAHAAMCDLSAELQELNAKNRNLTEHRLDLMQGDFTSLQSMIARAAGKSGESGEPAQGSLISLQA